VGPTGRGSSLPDAIPPLGPPTEEPLNEPALLFPPRPAYRFRSITEPMTMPDDPTEGRNAPYGAAINFSLKATPPDEMREKIKLVISDAGGKTVRTLDVGKEATAGINRVWWDLRMDPTGEPKLRTPPQHVPDFALNKEGLRKLASAGQLSVLVAPGTYTVKLIGAGVERSVTLAVQKDPNTAGTNEDVAAQTATMVAIRDGMNGTVATIDAAESVRAQLASW